MTDLQHNYATTDIQTAKELILEYLRNNDYQSYTYNDMAVILNITVPIAMSACRYLEEESLLISHNPKNSRKRLVYKYAEDSKFVCRYRANKQIKQKAIQKQIVRLTEDRPGIKSKEIHAAIKAYYFKIDRSAVAAALQALIDSGKLRVVESRKGSAITREHFCPTSHIPSSNQE